MIYEINEIRETLWDFLWMLYEWNLRTETQKLSANFYTVPTVVSFIRPLVQSEPQFFDGLHTSCHICILTQYIYIYICMTSPCSIDEMH